MVEKTEIQQLKEEYPEFFEKTAPEVIDFALSERTSEKIADIITKNGINDEEKALEITERIIWVLLGKLPSGNLAMAFELWVGLTPEIAKRIAGETNQFISSSMVRVASGETVQPKQELSEERMAEEKPKKPSEPDVYREPIE